MVLEGAPERTKLEMDNAKYVALRQSGFKAQENHKGSFVIQTLTQKNIAAANSLYDNASSAGGNYDEVTARA